MKVISSEYITDFSTDVELFLKRQPDVFDYAVDLDRRCMYVTVIFDNDYVIDDWVVNYSELTGDLDTDLAHIQQQFESITFEEDDI